MEGIIMEDNRRPEYYEDEIELIDYLRVLWRWKWVIALMVVICAGAAIGITMVKYPTKYATECIIALNFPGIEKHRNPDGTLFDKNQIITPAILSRAVASLEKEETLSLRGIIAIKAIMPPDVQAEKRKESYAFFPNQLSLTLATERENIFSEEEKSLILLSIVDEYRTEFERKYGEEPLVAISFPDDFLAKYDYGEVVDIFKTKIDTFIKFLDSKVKKAGFFRSQNTGFSFIDIKGDVESLRNIELSKTEAIIGTLKLTKNKEDLINQYKYNIREIEIRKRKKEKEASVAHRLLKEMRQTGRYELSKDASSEKGTSLVLDSSFIENLIKNDYFSSLLRTALKAEVEAKNLEVDKEFLEKKIDILKAKKEGKEKENIDCIQKSLKTIQDEISILSQRANELNMEYLRRSVAGAVQVIKDPETFETRSGNPKKTALLAAVVGLFFSIFLAFFIEHIRNASKAARKVD
jgi:capsular polysaccharide biosynthesis protein